MSQVIYTHGSFIPNPSIGGYAFAVLPTKFDPLE